MTPVQAWTACGQRYSEWWATHLHSLDPGIGPKCSSKLYREVVATHYPHNDPLFLVLVVAALPMVVLLVDLVVPRRSTQLGG